MSLGIITLYSATVPSGFSGTWPASSGAPTLSGTNGTLCAVLDWALAQKGWTTPYTSTNARVYKQAAGLGMSLSVTHDSAVSGAANKAVVRGCESATSVTALVNAFPTTVQVSNANQGALTASSAGSTAIPYVIQVSDRYLRVRVATTATGTVWSAWHFGDAVPADSSDAWFTVISASSTSGLSIEATLINYFVRDITGTINSSYSNFSTDAASTSIGNFPRGNAARSGYMNRVLRQKLSIDCYGSTTTSVGTTNQPSRVWVPNLWQPLHNGQGSLSFMDTFADSAYNPSALFAVYGPGAGQWSIDETTDTWAAPLG